MNLCIMLIKKNFWMLWKILLSISKQLEIKILQNQWLEDTLEKYTI